MAAPMTRTAVIDWLRAVPLFAELSDDELEMVAAASHAVTARKHTRVLEEGAPADCCLVLTSGRVRVVLGGWGDTEIVLGVVKPKSLLGEIALFNRSTRSASLVAAEDCHFIHIPAACFERLRTNRRFEDRVASHVIATLLRANDQVKLLSAPSTMTRVAGCLGRIARQEGEADGASIVIPRKRHQELADMIGCSRETVSRKLETLRRKKYVSWDKTAMRLDIQGLQRYVRMEFGVPGNWT